MIAMTRRFPLPSALALAVTLTLLLLPGRDLPDLPDVVGIDKLAHAVLFAALTLALHRDFRLEGRRLAVGAVFVIAFAAGTELAQGAVDSRSPDAFDLAADLAGSVIGWLARKPILSACAALASRLRKRGQGDEPPDPPSP